MELTTTHRRTECLSCGAGGLTDILSLGALPLANAFPPADYQGDEPRFPLDLAFCPGCSLVQLRHVVPPTEMFSEYLYFSSYSASMLQHAEALATTVIDERRLGTDSLVVEVASNDGYLLQFFKRAGVPVRGIEPAANVARVAEQERQIPTLNAFFTEDLARTLAEDGGHADVILGLNVMAHVPDLNGFVGGLRRLLKPDGVAIIEVPYVRDMVERTEFDTIYHEHLFYFSVTAVAALVSRHGLILQEVERVPVHGGSLRLTIGAGERHGNSAARLLAEEERLGLTGEAYYGDFRRAVETIRTSLRDKLEALRRDGATVAGYGAAAKATILLNYCELDHRAIAFVADRNPHKQGRRMPGCGIAILPVEAIAEQHPDYVLLFVWNIKDEILEQQRAYRARGGKFLVAIPEIAVL